MILIPIIIIAVVLAFLKSPKGRGWLGEMRVKLVLKKTKHGVRYVINNLVLRLENGKTTQIDHVLINKNGIFVIETKNYSGRIYGDEDRLEWTQVLNYGKTKNKLYNPIKQNKSHIYHISKILTENIPLTSVVVFVQGNIRYIDADGVYSLYGLKRLIRRPTTHLTPYQMKQSYTDLTKAHDATVTGREHIQNIRDTQRDLSMNICPRCGKQLVLRHGKNGDFMGCSGYPHCRFTKRV